MVFLKLGFSLTVRYLLPGRQRMECPAFCFVGDPLLGGPLWLDHFPFAFASALQVARQFNHFRCDSRFFGFDFIPQRPI